MKIHLDSKNTYGTINPKLHGQFIEFLGSCIDDGIWVGKDSTIPNIRGLRQDVVEALKALEPPIVRWPGGCYADTYHWRDGIGDPTKRPVTFNENFGTYELDQHQFGTDEFMDFCNLIGAEPWLNVNLLSGSVQEMKDWLEYCNRKQPTSLAKLRQANGHTEPYNVKYVGIGNEVWGGGGFMTPQQYAMTYRKYATAMPTFKTSLFDQENAYKIASGPDGNKPKERVRWTREFLAALANYRQPDIDAIDLHFYNWNIDHENDTPTDFTPNDWTRVIQDAHELDDVISEQESLITKGLANMPIPESTMDHRLDHIDLVVGEWGNWHRPAFTARPALHQQVTMRDALTTAISLNILQKHCDSVAMACVAQTVNVLNSLLLTDGDKTILTPNYDVFMMYKGHRGGHVLPLDAETPDVETFASVKNNTITVSLSNTAIREPKTITLIFDHNVQLSTAETLNATHVTDYNDAAHPNAVRRHPLAMAQMTGRQQTVTLPAASVTTLQFKLV
ncbi:beta-xylosidase alpha-L-arabinosidase [Levilactobacillus koreensis JCM 16448]|uniref:non-reducing end alpha-L-arabinofuranosidase n=1 Tax=Levilactobacillus koreensis TaxID=637971 RepID=A0AAC8UVN4_9LACO|nr:alpha-L-arabinofuranosidase C-terminal domain-containing protein [Levilactobacillus koreensis]AKP64249.1 alpha-L-arabinofuranosidase [Levilactobacillus koreensis]KRK92324.1 beta-xylosidase alpha-L-arabinosidase [Levilactobacillus koreensis JCM 16448]